MTAFIPKEAVTRFLGRNAPKAVSYGAAVAAGSLLAVCSCTIIPLFAGIYKRGAGLGPAITFLFFAPAANILALAYTGVALGMDLAIARIVLALSFGVGIGLIMALIFSRDEAVRNGAEEQETTVKVKVPTRNWVFLLVLVALLLAGTLRLPVLLNSYVHATLPISGTDQLQDALFRLVPFDASKGEEGVSTQGLILIVLLVMIGITAWFGLNQVDEGFNVWTWVSLGLTALTLLIASFKIVPGPEGLALEVTGRTVAVAGLLMAVGLMMRFAFDAYEVQEWLWQSWRFVKQIFPLLVVGVFIVGIIRLFIKPEWIETLAGENTLLGNMAGVAFGVFMYFPTLVEVPIAKMFLQLGMHPGPLLAYLMSDPELSLQSILLLTAIIGRVKAWTYVSWVALFSVCAGLLYGSWKDGTSIWLLLLILALLMAVLMAALWLIDRRNRRTLIEAKAVGGE
jgi:hypothetical protein